MNKLATIFALTYLSFMGAAAMAADTGVWKTSEAFSKPVDAIEINGITANEQELVLHTISGDVSITLPGKIDQILDFSGSEVALKLLGNQGRPTGRLIVLDVATGVARRFTEGSVYSARFLSDGSALVAVMWGTHELILIDDTGTTVLAGAVIPYSQYITGDYLVFGQDGQDEFETNVIALNLASEYTLLLETPEELEALLGQTKMAAAYDTVFDALISERVAYDSARIQTSGAEKSVVKSLGITLKAPFRSGERWQVTQGYGSAPDATSHAQVPNDMYAVDFALPGCDSYGRDVLAAAPGVVTFAGGIAANGCSSQTGGYGLKVEIDHGGGIVSLYGHNSRLTVASANTVGYGTKIAECGNSGWACGSACPSYPGTHIHFRLLQNGVPIPPEPIDGVTGIVTGVWITSTNGSTAPAVPALISPTNGANVSGTEVVLTWNGVSGATKYQSQITKDPTFATTYTGSEFSGTSNRWTGLPNNGSTWYWRARAGNAAGWSAWSSARLFVNGSLRAPAVPALMSPTNGANVSGTEVVLTWSSVSGATKYQSQITRDPTFATSYTGSEFSGTSNRWTGLPSNGSTWYWRARAGNAAGWSAWSAARAFVNGNVTVPTPAISRVSPSPAPGSWSKTTMTIYGAGFQNGATITWRDVTHGVSYPGRVPVSVSSGTIMAAPVFGPYAATWSARVINPDGKTSNELQFTVFVAQ